MYYNKCEDEGVMLWKEELSLLFVLCKRCFQFGFLRLVLADGRSSIGLKDYDKSHCAGERILNMVGIQFTRKNVILLLNFGQSGLTTVLMY